jgi:hypothetical protein
VTAGSSSPSAIFLGRRTGGWVRQGDIMYK